MDQPRRCKVVLPLLILVVAATSCSAFAAEMPLFIRRIPARRTSSVLQTSSSSWDDNLRQLKSIQERNARDALIDAIFLGDDYSSQSSSLLSIYLAGQARIPVGTNRTQEASATERIALVLTKGGPEVDNSVASSLLLPLASNAQLKLVSFAAAGRPLSKSVLLGLNTLLVNRDGALFDNLPWSTWSVDPQRRNYDEAGNAIALKFHLGKRDAYNRFMGKDWQGRSLAIGNTALRLRYMMEGAGEDTSSGVNSDEAFVDREDSQKVLATRMMELQIRELQMELAEVESQLAVARNNNGSTLELEQNQIEVLKLIASAQEDLASILQGPENVSLGIAAIMERIARWTTDDGKNAAPYRGAMGYAPMLDSKEDISDSLLPYTSPYDLLKEILEDQLNARAIGCVLENTSLLRGNLALGGAVVLQRRTPRKTTTIAGETLAYSDYDEDFGNEGIKPGETILVECDVDEAIGVALAFNAPIKIESEIFERAVSLVEKSGGKEEKSNNIIEFLSMFKTMDPKLNFQVEGEALLSESSSPISIPRTTSSLFDTIFEGNSKSSSLFPTDNPIKSLSEFDSLSNETKAKMLLEMSNFSGRLPRPRILRTSDENPLDQLLLPLIDESVRRQYNIREAEAKGDLDRAAELRSERSQRQAAKEQSKLALENGKEDDFIQWETEAQFLESLRADVTQDEGAYSRFLDRDYWYEKDRQATAKRVDRSKFGNLLDGIE
jgi:hypothetical protein